MAGTDKRDQVRTRVFIVDDHPAICEALGQVINDQVDMEVCGFTGRGRDAFDLVCRERPDVAVIDIVLQDRHGLELTQSIVTAGLATQVIVYSMHDERVYAERALRAGARGYLMKSEPTRSVVEAIRRVRRGEITVSSEIASRILSNLASGLYRQDGAAGPQPPSSLNTLTDRELMVFHLLGRGLTAAEIGDELSLDRKTIETYRRRIRQKLGFRNNTELLQYAFHYMSGELSTT